MCTESVLGLDTSVHVLVNLIADHKIIKTEEFGNDYIIVTLQWTNESFYNITVGPYLPFMFLESTSVQLRVPYNTLYNVSILRIDPCGQKSSFEVYYG